MSAATQTAHPTFPPLTVPLPAPSSFRNDVSSNRAGTHSELTPVAPGLPLLNHQSERDHSCAIQAAPTKSAAMLAAGADAGFILTRAQSAALYDAWMEIDHAAGQMLRSPPAAMQYAVARLESARATLRALIEEIMA